MGNQNLSEDQRLNALTTVAHLLIGSGWEELKKEIKTIMVEVISESHFSNTTHSQEEEYLDRKQAAVFLKCSETKLYYLLRDNKVPHYKIGRRTLFKKSELLEHFKTNAKRGK